MRDLRRTGQGQAETSAPPMTADLPLGRHVGCGIALWGAELAMRDLTYAGLAASTKGDGP